MNLQEETRNGYTITAQMKQLWAIQIQMATYLFEVCKKYGLSIWANSGTLLGTVREKGYIPWDDDMDYMMFRDDYDKLIAVADKEFKSPYHLQSFGRDRHYYRGHAQMRIDGTSAILPYDLWQPFHQGVFIDIFVYDSIPNQETIDWEKTVEKADFIQGILSSTAIHNGPVNSVETYIKWIQSWLYCLINGKKNLIEQFDDCFRQFNTMDNNRVAAISFVRKLPPRVIFYKEWFRETIYLPFEDITMPVPIDYDKVLCEQYGNNYMIPVKDPSMHGCFEVLDINRDYKQVIKELRRKRKMNRIKHLFLAK